MTRAELKGFLVRHKASIIDLSVLLATLALAVYFVFAVNIFEHQAQITREEAILELDEALLLGSLLIAGLFTFGIRRHIAQKREILRRIAAEREARVLAYQDALTGLPNRRRFDEALREAIGSPPGDGWTHALFLLDLNGFKQVNDIHGHNIGDEVLIVVGQRLMTVVRDGDLVARLGGDEFAIVAKQLRGAEGATTIARRIIGVLETPIKTGDTEHRVGTAIGIALIPADATSNSEAVRKADVALYRAKAERRSAARFFKEDMDRLVHERAETEQALREAMQAGQIETLFLPTVDLRTGQVMGFEATPRWNDPLRGEIGPERFVAIAEEAGLIHALARDVLRQACAAAVLWPPQVQLSCDIYGSQLKDEALATSIAAILDETGLAPGRLELDVTEAAVVRDVEAAARVFGELRDLGVRIALDNFGTGYSSLYHLRAIKLDKIKIDSSFVAGLASDQQSAEIVGALVGMGHGLGLPVSAKGVIDDAQRERLIGSGCDLGQGGLFSRPVRLGETVALLAAAPVTRQEAAQARLAG